MKYTRAIFHGYIGFYNGMGIDHLDIDFTKCKYNIILITGMNGSGKSTLQKALNIFPDSSTDYIPNMNAYKYLSLIDRENNIYEIKIMSDINNKGGRKTTKVSIKKNGLELNPNGNVSSYTDIIYNEFDLDSIFLSLTRMSSEDRGIADKTPSERKRFTSKILDNIQVYNDIHKNLSKKSTVLKSNINNLHNKIQTIGNKDNLVLSLKKMESERKNINEQINAFNTSIIELKTKYSISETDNDDYNSLLSEKEKLLSDIDNIKLKLKQYLFKTKINGNDINNKLDSDNNLLIEYNENIIKLQEKWKSDSKLMKDNNESISNMEIELSSFEDDNDNTIESEYNNMKEQLSYIESNYIIPNNHDEFIDNCNKIFNFYDIFIDQIDNLYKDCSLDDMNIILNYNQNYFDELNKKLKDISYSLSEIKDNISSLDSDNDTISILDNRPNNCSIDNCPFIKQALSLKNKYKNNSIKSKKDKLLKKLEDFTNDYTDIENKINIWNSLSGKKMIFDTIRDSILKNKELFLFFNDKLSNIDYFYKGISNKSPFNDQRDPVDLKDKYNVIITYKDLKSKYDIVYEKYKSYIAKSKMISSISDRLNKLKKEQSELIDITTTTKNKIDELSNTKVQLQQLINQLNEYKSYDDKYKELESKLNDISNEISKYESKSDKAIKSIGLINKYYTEIDSLKSKLEVLNNNIGSCNAQLGIIDNYYNEYKEYSEKYNIIEILKKYCSPTSTGIQTIFMQIYMSKTLGLANNILSMLFGGQYQLLDFIINESEFRIPFIGSGLSVDDISSGSTSQVCMMGTIINLVLMNQASSKFNIARLDEVDGGLDHKNRYDFINVLYRIMPLLNIDQLFLISHSLEADTSAVDIIKLKNYQEYESNILGNVIYDFNTDIYNK